MNDSKGTFILEGIQTKVLDGNEKYTRLVRVHHYTHQQHMLADSVYLIYPTSIKQNIYLCFFFLNSNKSEQKYFKVASHFYIKKEMCSSHIIILDNAIKSQSLKNQ